MKRILIPVALGLAITGFSQKKICFKKNTVKLNDEVIAEYDGQGSMFKMVKLGVFAPGSKDTLIRVTEDNYNAQNPLFPATEVVYLVEFPNSNQPGFYINNPKKKGVRVMEKGTMEILFSEEVPVLISGGKIDEAAAASYRQQHAYDFDGFKKHLKEIEDSIATISQPNLNRDRTKPVTLKTISNQGDAMYSEQVNEIYQDNVLIGKVEKKTTGGSFPKTEYAFWKKVPAVTLNNTTTEFVPMAICTTGPNGGDIVYLTVVGKKKGIVKGTYNNLDALIATSLISQQAL